MAAFNLTAELNLRGPSNLNQIVGDIRRQLSSISFNLNINPSTSRGIQQITSSVNTLSTALRDAQTNAAGLTNALRGLGVGINSATSGMNTLQNGINNANTQINNLGANTRNAGTEMAEFGRQSALAIRRFAAFSVATGAVYALVRAVSSAYDEFVSFNQEFVRLQQVTNSTAAGLGGLSNEITRLATSLGVGSSELLKVSSTLAQAGLSASQTKTALEALAKSALAPSFDNLNDTVEGSIALMRQFGLSAGDLESALGSINAVAAKFAVESSDIITAIQRTGGVFASASKGVSEGKDALNEFIAVFTSVRATTRESAETIATGLRTIFTRIQRGGTIEALKEYGVTLTDLEGKFVGPYEAIRRLSDGLKSLDPRDIRFAKIVEELGGFRQIGKVIPLIQQFATAQQALGVAQRGAGSLTSDAAKAQEALAIRITKVREEFVALIRDIGQSQSFQTFADIALKLASALISVASAAKDVLPALAALASIRAIPALTQFASGFAGGIGRRPRGFAKGGYVPGSGNGDTVPAMLTPGEFVIRKKAVESIGVNNLRQMNKYAGGGSIKNLSINSAKGAILGQKRLTALEMQKAAKMAGYDIERLDNGKIELSRQGKTMHILNDDEASKMLGSFITGYNSGGFIQKFQRGREVEDIRTGLGSTRLEKSFGGLTTAKGLGTIQSLPNRIQNIPDNQDVYGAAFLSPEGSVQDLKGTIEPGLIKKIVTDTNAYKILSKAGGVGADKALATTIKQSLAKIEQSAIQKGDFTLIAEALSETKSSKIENTIIGRVYDAVEEGAKELSQATKIQSGGTAEATRILKQSNIDNIIGNVYEAILTNTNTPPYGEGDRDKANDPFDFPSGLGGAASNFSGGRLSSIRTDAKTRFTASNISTFLNKAKNYESKKLTDQIESILDDPGVISAFSNRGSNPRADVRDLVEKRQATRRALGGFIPEFSSGGSPEDTVPALLTPGEFVINKKAASRIGKSKLHQLNKADKLKGFNKGGAVGNIQSFAGGGGVQRFFVGGLVRAFEGLTRIVGNLGTRMALLGRNMPSGGGWNPAAGATRLSTMGVPAGRGGGGGGGIGLALAFLGPMIAEAINSSISSRGGSAGAQAGSVISAGISGAALGSIAGPWGALAGAVVGATAAFANLSQVAAEYEVNEKQKIIEAKAIQLDKSFEKLSKEVDATKIKELRTTVAQNISQSIAAQKALSSARIQQATPSTIGRSVFGAQINIDNLSKDLADAGRVGGENAQKYIIDALSRSSKDFNLDDLNRQFDKTIAELGTGAQEAIAIAIAGPELTKLRAQAKEAKQAGKEAESSNYLKQYRQRISEIVNEFKTASVEQENAKRNVQAVTIAVDNFSAAIKILGSVISRASAEFEEAQRLMEIDLGSAFGDQLRIQEPSTMNQNILENPAAYSTEEISSAVQNLGKNLKFDPEFTTQLENATIAQKELQTRLPQILAEAGARQKTPGTGQFTTTDQKAITDELIKVFKSVPGLSAGDAESAASQLFDEISAKMSSSDRAIGYDDVAGDSATLSKITAGYTSSVESVQAAQKEQDRILASVNNSLNRYVNALDRATELQIQAASIRTQGGVQLQQALGQQLDLNALNQAFEDSIKTLTSTVGPGGIRQQGTLDADEIARRLAQAEKEQADLQKQGQPIGGNQAQIEAYNRQLADATTKAKNLSKAQEKLASDTTRASNALNKIQSLRQAQEGRRNVFSEVVQNIRNPEWMMEFTRNVQSLIRVQSGAGTMDDIEGAYKALEKRLQGMEPGAAQAEREKFDRNLLDILQKQAIAEGLPPNAAQALFEAIKTNIGAGGLTDPMKDAIANYEAAIESQARAVETMAERTTTASQTFFDKIIESANKFAERVGQAGVIPQQPPAQDGVAASTGGLIYASKGKLINFQPKGTDTVPAMLTPGEFVVNRKATQKNLPLLKAINDGSKAYSKGGLTYAANGGEIGKETIDKMTQTFGKITTDNFPEAVKQILNNLNILKSRAKLTPNVYDRYPLDEFGTSISGLVNRNSKEITKMRPSDFVRFMQPYYKAFSILKTKLRSPSGNPEYLVDDIPGAKKIIKKEEAQDARAPEKLLEEASIVKTAQQVSKELKEQQGVQPEIAAANIKPDYYDELTYKEYIKNLLSQGFAPIAPDKSKFVTPAIYYNKNIQGSLNPEQEKAKMMAEGQIVLWKQAWEEFANNISQGIVPERALRPGAARDALVNAASDFKNWLEAGGYDGYSNPLGITQEQIKAIYTAANISSGPTSIKGRGTAFDFRNTTGIVGGSPLPEAALDEERISLIAGSLKAYTDSAYREMQDYLSTKNIPERADFANKSLEIMGSSYREAVIQLNELTKEANIARISPRTIKTLNDKKVNIPTIVGQLNKIKEVYASNLGGADLPAPLALNDEILNSFATTGYAPIVEQNVPQDLPKEPIQGRNIVSGFKPEEKSSIRAYAGIEQQYKSAYLFYRNQLGKYNVDQERKRRREEFLAERESRRLTFDNRGTQNFNTGGIVYAQKGQLINVKPKGTDTVPAMLTPGEFVVNRQATQRNLPLLKAINSNVVSPKGFKNGGIISPQYYANGDIAVNNGGGGTGVSLSIDTSKLDASFGTFGGFVNTLSGSLDGFASTANTLVSGLGELNNLANTATAISAAAALLSGSAGGLNTSISNFNTTIGQLRSALEAMPDSIDLRVSGSIPVSVNVTVNDGRGLQNNLQQFAETIYNEVSSAISSATSGALKVNFNTSRK